MSQQNVSSEWCVAHLEDANAALADLHDPTRYTKLIYRPLQEHHLKLVVIADASERKKASKYGQICVHIYLMGCVPPTLLGGRLHHLEHRSKKASRVSKSSLMVELLGQCKASEMGQRAVAWLREMWLGMESVKELMDVKPIIPVALVTDANDIYLSLMCDKPFSGADESACLYLESLREDLRIGRISELFWVPTDTMTCDGGTKAKTDTVMPTVMAEGSWWPREYKALRRREGGGLVVADSDSPYHFYDEVAEVESGEATFTGLLSEGCGGLCPQCRPEEETEDDDPAVYWMAE
jgi:hypothetical protein